MATKNKRTVKKINEQDTPIILMIPIILVVAVIPLIVRMKSYDTGLQIYDWFSSNGDTSDFFAYVKMLWLITVSVIMAIIIIFKWAVDRKEIKFSKVFIPLGVYALLAIVSSIASDYKPYPFTGIYEQLEPLWVLLGYCLMAYYVFLYINTERDLDIILWAFTVGVFLLVLLGVSQMLFTDFFRTDFGMSLMLPGEIYEQYLKNPDGIRFTFEQGRAYLTFYNPNYVGSFASVVSPLFLVLVFAEKRVWRKCIYGALYVGIIFVLLGSQSRAGFVGVVASVLVLMVIFNKKLLKNWFPVTVILILAVGTIYTYNNYTNGLIVNKIKAAFNSPETVYNLTDMETNDDDVVITYKGSRLHLSWEEDGLGGLNIYPRDDEGRDLEVSFRGDEYYTVDILSEPFTGIAVSPILMDANHVGIKVDIEGKSWYFTEDNNTVYLWNNYGKMTKMHTAESVEWLGRHARFASGRGFIWSRTIPLLKDNIILGSGADTFIFEFPNDDYVASYNAGYDGVLISKPHNMYLQMAVQTGALSVIAFLAFYGWFFIRGIIICFKLKKYSLWAYVGIASLAGTFGYMVVQMINDSSTSVAPFYWVIVGLGMAALRKAKKENDEAAVPAIG